MTISFNDILITIALFYLVLEAVRFFSKARETMCSLASSTIERSHAMEHVLIGAVGVLGILLSAIYYAISTFTSSEPPAIINFMGDAGMLLSFTFFVLVCKHLTKEETESNKFCYHTRCKDC